MREFKSDGLANGHHLPTQLLSARLQSTTNRCGPFTSLTSASWPLKTYYLLDAGAVCSGAGQSSRPLLFLLVRLRHALVSVQVASLLQGCIRDRSTLLGRDIWDGWSSALVAASRLAIPSQNSNGNGTV